jgi:hypothetical protein
MAAVRIAGVTVRSPAPRPAAGAARAAWQAGLTCGAPPRRSELGAGSPQYRVDVDVDVVDVDVDVIVTLTLTSPVDVDLIVDGDGDGDVAVNESSTQIS